MYIVPVISVCVVICFSDLTLTQALSLLEVENGKCETLQEGETCIFLYEPESF